MSEHDTTGYHRNYISLIPGFKSISFSPDEPQGGDPKSDEGGDSLADAVNKALAELDPDKGKEKEKEKAPDSKEKEKEKETENEEEIDPEEAKQGINLLRLINNPETSKETIVLLMKQMGITADAPKEEKKEVVKDIKAMFKEALGEDLAFMSDNLYSAIEKITNHIAEEKTKDIRASVKEASEARQRETLSAAYDKVEAQFSNFKDVQKDIFELSKSIKIQPGQSPEKYYSMLFYTACGEKGLAPTKASGKPSGETINKDKLNKARNESKSRLDSERENTSDEQVLPQAKSLSEAIASAVKLVEARK